MPSVWGKLDANLAAIYRDYLEEKEQGARPGGRLEVLLTYEGDLAEIEALGFHTTSRMRRGGSAGGFIDLADMERLAAHPGVSRFSFGDIPTLTLATSVPDIHANEVWTQTGTTFGGNAGQDVIIGIIDSGIDFRNPTFDVVAGATPRKTRIRRFWDQMGDLIPGGSKPDPELLSDDDLAVTESYGLQYTDTMLNTILQSAPHEVTQDPAADAFSHGTCVASIAAGNGGPDHQYVGVAPRANLIVVRYVAISERESTLRFRHAVNYVLKSALDVAAEDGKSYPVVINGSFSQPLSAHDGQSPMERFLDQRLKGIPGEAYVASAGNAAGFCLHPPDKTLGSPMVVIDRKHQHALIKFKKDAAIELPIELRDVTTFSSSVSQWGPGVTEKRARRTAEMRIYYGPGAALRCTISPPHGETIKAPDLPGFNQSGFMERWKWQVSHLLVEDGLPSRGNVLSFRTDTTEKGRFRDGIYTLQLSLDRDAHAHLYCDNIDFGGFRVGDHLPPEADVTAGYMIGAPSGALHAITVASYDHAATGRPVSDFSSRGPLVSWGTTPPAKPDLAAPGSSIEVPVPGLLKTTAETGTSASAPHVAGTIALMFGENRNLTVAEIRSILAATVEKRTNDAAFTAEEMGAGRLNAKAAVEKAKSP